MAAVWQFSWCRSRGHKSNITYTKFQCNTNYSMWDIVNLVLPILDIFYENSVVSKRSNLSGLKKKPYKIRRIKKCIHGHQRSICSQNCEKMTRSRDMGNSPLSGLFWRAELWSTILRYLRCGLGLVSGNRRNDFFRPVAPKPDRPHVQPCLVATRLLTNRKTKQQYSSAKKKQDTDVKNWNLASLLFHRIQNIDVNFPLRCVFGPITRTHEKNVMRINDEKL